MDHLVHKICKNQKISSLAVGCIIKYLTCIKNHLVHNDGNAQITYQHLKKAFLRISHLTLQQPV